MIVGNKSKQRYNTLSLQLQVSVTVLCIFGFLISPGYSNVILMSYACVRSYHYILLEIKLEQGLVTVLDSRRKDPQDYADMTEMLQK